MSLNLSTMQIKIMACVNDSSEKLSITDIRKRIDCSTNHSIQSVDHLIKLGLLDSEKVGRKKFISVKNKNLAAACSILSKN